MINTNKYLILLIVHLTGDREGGDRTDFSLKLEQISATQLTPAHLRPLRLFPNKNSFCHPGGGQFQSLLFPENLFACFSKLFCQFKDRDGKE